MSACGRVGRSQSTAVQRAFRLLNPVLHACPHCKERTLGFFFLPAPGTFRRKRPEFFGIRAEDPPLRPFQAGAVEQMPFARTAEGGRGSGCRRAQRVESNAGADA